MSRTHKGYFKPTKPEKYNGDAKNIIYRSGWELTYMSRLDRDDNILWWSSEEYAIPYRSPIDNSFHNYYPDFLFKTIKGIFMIEIKPFSQTQPPKLKTKYKTKRFLTEQVTFLTNQAKFEAAKAFCNKKGWTFIVMTEKELGLLR